ncbi:hypothetical protein HQ531_06420 [bacterium]|nr:hypothetical protein [bacterium]
MKTRTSQITLIILILSASVIASNTLTDARYDDLPKGVYTALVGAGFFDKYDLYFQMSPFFQRGDFNGDGEIDIAIQVLNKFSHKRGIVFLHSNDLSYNIIGAGKNFGNLGDDFSWLRKWRIDSFTHVKGGNSDGAEALILDNPDFPKSLVYYDGKTYQTQAMDAYSYYSDGPIYSQAEPLL